MVHRAVAVLLVEKGMSEASVIPLGKEVYILGRSPTVDISMDNPYVSGRHAQITSEEGRFQICDLGSKNGTFINGYRLRDEKHWLRNGDRIEVARGQVVLRYHDWSSTITVPVTDQAVVQELVVDFRKRDVWVGRRKVEPPLARKEFDLLNLLYRRRGEVCSKDEIAAAGWPERGGGDVADEEIEQCVRRVRLRIEPDPSKPRYVLTVRGHGYRLSED